MRCLGVEVAGLLAFCELLLGFWLWQAGLGKRIVERATPSRFFYVTLL